MDLITEYVIRYGFLVLGVVLVYAVGTLVARWAGKLTQQWLERHDMEPPIRMLLVKIIQVLVLLFTTMAALGHWECKLRRYLPASASPDWVSAWHSKAC